MSSSSLLSVVIYRNNVHVAEQVAAAILVSQGFVRHGHKTNQLVGVPCALNRAVLFGGYWEPKEVKTLSDASSSVEIYAFAGDSEKYENLSDNIKCFTIHKTESEVHPRIVKLYAPGFSPSRYDVEQFIHHVHLKRALNQKDQSPVTNALIEWIYTSSCGNEWFDHFFSDKYKGESFDQMINTGTLLIKKTESQAAAIASKGRDLHLFGYKARVADASIAIEAVMNALLKGGADIGVVTRFDHEAGQTRVTIQTYRNDINLQVQIKDRFNLNVGGREDQIGGLNPLDTKSFLAHFDTSNLQNVDQYLRKVKIETDEAAIQAAEFYGVPVSSIRKSKTVQIESQQSQEEMKA